MSWEAWMDSIRSYTTLDADACGIYTFDGKWFEMLI